MGKDYSQSKSSCETCYNDHGTSKGSATSSVHVCGACKGFKGGCAASQVQGDFVEKAADLIVKTYKDKGIEKKHIYVIADKRKEPYFDEEDDDDEED